MNQTIKKHLKQKAHSLNPVVILGASGLTDGVHNEIELALESHELIKIRVNAENREQRQQLSEIICKKHNAEMIQAIGHIIAIYRQRQD
ncbi:MAG: ribosome assembly RNA-binding protein YhbY [Coxiellaceae bacterium]|nr:ribosome assembly RNA-binding protein YhbY [Coxiellaceae bacterium]